MKGYFTFYFCLFIKFSMIKFFTQKKEIESESGYNFTLFVSRLFFLKKVSNYGATAQQIYKY